MLYLIKNCTIANQLQRAFVAVMVGFFVFLPASAHAGAYDDFFKAVQFDDVVKIRSLLNRGLDPNIIEAVRGETGLIQALREDADKVFLALINAHDINFEVRARNGDTALMIAAFRGKADAAVKLLEKGAEPNQQGWAALHYAATVGNNEIVKILLDHSAYIDAESPNKTTPIMMAARAGHIYTVKLLLDEGADATLKNDQGLTAIDFAQRNNHKDIAEGIAFQLKKAGKM